MQPWPEIAKDLAATAAPVLNLWPGKLNLERHCSCFNLKNKPEILTNYVKMFANFLHFWAHLKPSFICLTIVCDFLRFLVDFWWFGEDFGRVLGRFWACFCTFFRIFA